MGARMVRQKRVRAMDSPVFGSTAFRGRIVLLIEMSAGGRRGILHVGPDGSRLELIDSHAAA